MFILTIRIRLERKGSVADLLQMCCKNIFSHPNSPFLASSHVPLDKDKQGPLGLFMMNS